MTIKTLIENIWRFANDGRVKATLQSVTQADISQKVKATLGKMLFVQYYDSRKQDEFLEADYSFYSQLLSKQPFTLSEPNYLGERTIDLSGFQLYTLPKNKHIVSMTMVGTDCQGKVAGNVTQISPGEEQFYIYDPSQNNFRFFRPTAKSCSTWNIPPCVKQVIIESTFDSDELEISFDIAFEVGNYVLGVVLGLPDFLNKGVDNPYTPLQKAYRKNLQQTKQEQAL